MSNPKGAFASFSITLEGADGGFEIRPSPTKGAPRVWIQRIGGTHAGEGGDFSAGALLEVIEKFYNKHF